MIDQDRETPPEEQAGQEATEKAGIPDAGEPSLADVQARPEQEAAVAEAAIAAGLGPKPDLASQIQALQAQLAEAQARTDEYLDGWQRSRAEFANFRRRQEQWKSTVYEQATSRLLTNLLPVLDDLQRAFEGVPQEARDHAWVEGLALVGRKLDVVLKKEGLAEIPVQPGDAFDPNYHQAILHEPSNEFAEGQIVTVLQKGYRFNNVVLRPAVVRVSSGKVQESQDAGQTDA
jgi:molecular chaperone GrpE